MLALIMLAAGPAWAQRVQFPTMVSPSAADPGAASAPAAAAAPATATPVVTVAAAPPPASAAPASSAVTFAGSPSSGPPILTGPLTPVPPGTTFDPYADPMSQPTYSVAQAPPPAPTYSPYAPSPYAPPPAATAPPVYSSTPGALYPDVGPAPAAPARPYFPPGTQFPALHQPLRLLQGVWLRDTYLFGIGGSNALSVNDTEFSATFAVPLLFNQPPLLITPGFGVHFWGGPSTTPTQPADLPPETYDAYLDLAWQPKVNEWLSFNLGARAGIYSDFHAVDFQSIRIMGRGLAVVAVTPNVQIAAGVVYIDRLPIKLLPAGGFIWTPNPDTRFEVLFPNPKISHRWTTIGTTDLWCYLAGEYGGGAWTVRRAFTGADDDVGYNDIRVMLGLETFGTSRYRGMFEVGGVFNRQLVYRSGTPQFDPSDTVMLRAGLVY